MKPTQMMKKSRAMVLAMAFLALAGIPSADASTLSVTPQGGGTFLLQGADLAGAAAMDITLQYDPSALKNPRVEQGMLISGAMMAVNPNVPGVIRIAVIRLTPITGSGTIASLAFDTIGNASSPIKGLTVKFTDINGNPLQAQTQVSPSSETAGSTASEQPASQGKESQTAAATTPSVKQAIAPTTAPVIIVGPSESGISQPEKRPDTTRETVPPAPEMTIAKTDEAAHKGPEKLNEPPVGEKAVYTQKSVLDLFKAYKGPRTPKALMALFEHEPLIGCKQDPALVLSDGRSLAKVTFIAPVDQKGSPDIALVGATLVSLERDRENSNTWIATVRPHRNALEAKITIPLKDAVMVFPLTVAPKVNITSRKAGKVSEADFDEYLRGSGGKKAEVRDLNEDGKINYLDDYIFTANYLAKLKGKGRTASLK